MLRPMPNPKTDMTGKVVLVTGASSGIGKVTAVALARMGARVLILCRDAGRGGAALEEVHKANSSAELVLGDLASPPSLRKAAEDVRSRTDRLHVLVNNAGLWSGKRIVSEAGLEMMFASNHVGTFLLTHLLLDLLKASAPSRIVIVASRAHRRGHMHWDDLQLERRFSSIQAYAQSKLANILFTRELARRLEGTSVTANSVHPGVVATDLWRGLPRFVVAIGRLFLLTPEQGAEGQVRLATSPEVEGVTGRYFERTSEAEPTAEGSDDAAAKRLWEVTERLLAMA